MSTKLCLFGVVPSTSDADVLAACAKVYEERPPTRGYVGIQSAETLKARKWFYLIVDEGWHWVFEYVAGKLAREFGDLTALLYMDNVGTFKFARYSSVGPEDATDTPTLGLNSEGLFMDVYAGALGGDHPELALTRAQVTDLQRKSEGELTEAEITLINSFRNAVRLGLAECHPDDGVTALRIGYEREVVCLVENRELVEPRKIEMMSLKGALDNLPQYAEILSGGERQLFETESLRTHAEYDRFKAAHNAGDWQQVIASGWRLLDMNAHLDHFWSTTWANAFSKLGDFAAALKITERSLPASYERGNIDDIGLDLYNRACYLAQLGRLDEALGALTSAAKLDPAHGVDAADDSDFAALHADEKFVELVTRATEAAQSSH